MVKMEYSSMPKPISLNTSKNMCPRILPKPALQQVNCATYVRDNVMKEKEYLEKYLFQQTDFYSCRLGPFHGILMD